MEKILAVLASWRWVLGLLTFIEKIPLPYSRIKLRVQSFKMSAPVFDRFAALVMWSLGLLEADESQWIRNLCRPGMQAVDIGANIGFHTLQMAAAVGDGGRVWAFEPDPDNYQALKVNLTQNSCTNVTAEQAAVGVTSGSISLFRSPAHHGDHRIYPADELEKTALSVQAYALDDYFEAGTRIGFIKIDIQGAEGLALQGMRRLLQSNPELVMLMEFWPAGIRKSGFQPQALLESLQKAGFRIYELAPAQPHHVGDFEAFIQSIPAQGYRNLLVCRDLPDRG